MSAIAMRVGLLIGLLLAALSVRPSSDALTPFDGPDALQAAADVAAPSSRPTPQSPVKPALFVAFGGRTSGSSGARRIHLLHAARPHEATYREHRGRAELHVPRRRLPRLRDDAEYS